MQIREDDKHWIQCDGEIWDYEKGFYRVLTTTGPYWVWPNAGKLHSVTSPSKNIPISTVITYRYADNEFFEKQDQLMLDSSEEVHFLGYSSELLRLSLGGVDATSSTDYILCGAHPKC